MENRAQTVEEVKEVVLKRWDGYDRARICELLSQYDIVVRDVEMGRADYWEKGGKYIEPWTWDRRCEDQEKLKKLGHQIMECILPSLRGYESALKAAFGIMGDLLPPSVRFDPAIKVRIQEFIDRFGLPLQNTSK
jgi:hypothetical protein